MVELHFFAHNELCPAESCAGCYIRVLDAESIYRAFALANLPRSGIPRLDALEDKPWEMREFAVVAPDGNLLRIGQTISFPKGANQSFALNAVQRRQEHAARINHGSARAVIWKQEFEQELTEGTEIGKKYLNHRDTEAQRKLKISRLRHFKLLSLGLKTRLARFILQPWPRRS